MYNGNPGENLQLTQDYPLWCDWLYEAVGHG